MRVSLRRNAVLCGMAIAATGCVVSSRLIDVMKQDIFVVTPKTFDSQITKQTVDGVAAVLFYRDNPTCKSLVDGAFGEYATEVKGMAKVASVNCDEFNEFCDKHTIKEFPTIVIYPPKPIPAITYQGPHTKKALTSATLKHIKSSHVVMLKQDEMSKVEAFLATGVSVPKVLLFSERMQPSVLFNALANTFHDRMSFGFVAGTESQLAKRFAVKKMPTLTVLKGEIVPGKAGDVYSGDMKFAALHEFLNARSETFVRGGGYQSDNTVEELKPWLVQKVPEITRDSYLDVCFKQRALCVIYAGQPSSETMTMLEDLQDKYSATSSTRSAQFKFSWIDLNLEPKFAEMLKVDASKPTALIFNPNKRLRFMLLSEEEEPTDKSISNLIERLLGGDARFTNVPGLKLPPFTVREKVEGSKDEL